MPTPTAATLASSVQGLALRVTALNSDGTAVTGTSSAYTMNRFVTAQFTPVYAGSNNIRQQLANGNFAVTFQTSRRSCRSRAAAHRRSRPAVKPDRGGRDDPDR